MANTVGLPIGPQGLDLLHGHFRRMVDKLADVDSAADRLKLAKELEDTWQVLHDAYSAVAFRKEA